MSAFREGPPLGPSLGGVSLRVHYAAHEKIIMLSLAEVAGLSAKISK